MVLLIRVFLCSSLAVCIAHNCLQSPPELELIRDGDQNDIPIYRGTLIFDAAAFTTEDNGYPTSFTTRVYNGNLPSPTIRMKQDTIYKITLVNDLGPNVLNDTGIMNEFHYPNTTNLHTHGIP